MRSLKAAVTFIVRFRTAQFKLHFQKLARRTYLIPPPSAVAGIFGAILGVERNKLEAFCEENSVMTGAELRNLEGYYITLSRIFKFDRDARDIVRLLEEFWTHTPRGKRTLESVYKDVYGLMPIKESEELFKPEYKLAMVARNELVKKVLRRLRAFDFEYEIFGGNDYHLVEHMGKPREARVIKSKRGRGYCPASELEKIEALNYKIILNTKNSFSKSNLQPPIVFFADVGLQLKTFAFVYGANIITKTERDAVQDEESTIYVYRPQLVVY